MRQAWMHWCTSTMTGASPVWNASYNTQCQWELQIRRCANRIWIYTYCSLLCSLFQLWFICPGWQWWWSIYSRFADFCRCIHWLVHYKLRGNTTHSQFLDDSSLLGEPDCEDESWLKKRDVWVLSLSTYIGYCKVYFAGHIYLHH